MGPRRRAWFHTGHVFAGDSGPFSARAHLTDANQRDQGGTGVRSKCLFVDFFLCGTLPYLSLQASALIYLLSLSKAILRLAFSSLSFDFAQRPAEHLSSPSAALPVWGDVPAAGGHS